MLVGLKHQMNGVVSLLGTGEIDKTEFVASKGLSVARRLGNRVHLGIVRVEA
jgi:hypothetical protein